MTDLPKFAISMVTYNREDGTTKEKIKKAIESIKSQTYDNWKVFLVGDHYTNYEEFEEISNLLPKEKITAVNLPVAAERESGDFNGHSLWCSAGANATNKSIELELSEGFQIHCHLDDDDEWLPYHLDILKMGYQNFPESIFIYTNSFYVNQAKQQTLFPQDRVPQMLHYNNLPPRPCRLIHSTASWRIDKIPFRMRTSIEQGRIYPGDADMWERVNKWCQQNGEKSLYIPITTVMKYSEGG